MEKLSGRLLSDRSVYVGSELLLHFISASPVNSSVKMRAAQSIRIVECVLAVSTEGAGSSASGVGETDGQAGPKGGGGVAVTA